MSVIRHIWVGIPLAILLSFVAIPTSAWSDVHNDSTECGAAEEALVPPGPGTTLSPSEFKAARRFQDHQKRQKRWEENQIERNRLEIENQFPGSKVRYLTRGGESLIYSVSYPDPQNRSLAVKVPLHTEHDRRVLLAYENERAIHEQLLKSDPEGARHVMPLLPAPEINFENRKLKPLVMELGSKSLREFLPDLGPETDRKVMLNLWKEMALGVRAVSRANYVHRDIKPANWIVKRDADGTPHLLLTDFGLARVKGDRPDDDSLQGTLTFMSDNQMKGGAPAPADDLHALLSSMKETLIGNEIWKLSPKDPKNHVRLVDVDFWGRYPVLDQLPDATRESADPRLVRLLTRPYQSVDELLAEIDFALTHP